MHLKVLGLGLSKTGTTSLGLALECLGYRNYDCPDAISRLSGFDSATDSTAAMWWRHGKITADKYILTLRDIGEWLQSAKFHWSKNRRFYDAQKERSPALWEMRQYFYAGNDYDEDLFRKAYLLHEDEVIKKARPLLIYRLCDKAGWNPLCQFLGKPIPVAPFPHANRRSIKSDH